MEALSVVYARILRRLRRFRRMDEMKFAKIVAEYKLPSDSVFFKVEEAQFFTLNEPLLHPRSYWQQHECKRDMRVMMPGWYLAGGFEQGDDMYGTGYCTVGSFELMDLAALKENGSIELLAGTLPEYVPKE